MPQNPETIIEKESLNLSLQNETSAWQKNSINEVKDNGKLRKLFATYTTDKELISLIYLKKK